MEYLNQKKWNILLKKIKRRVIINILNLRGEMHDGKYRRSNF